MPLKLCVDPEKIISYYPTSTFLVVYEWFEDLNLKYCYKRAIIGPPAKRHLNGVSLACCWWPNIECRLGSFVIFQGIWTKIAKNPYIVVIFQGGPDPPDPSPPDCWCTFKP